MAKSIIQTERECWKCHNTQGLELHHIFFGTANRKLSDEDGLVVFLCYDHHRGAQGVHNNNKKLNLELKQTAELAFLSHYDKTIEDFIKKYGRNYLEEPV